MLQEGMEFEHMHTHMQVEQIVMEGCIKQREAKLIRAILPLGHRSQYMLSTKLCSEDV